MGNIAGNGKRNQRHVWNRTQHCTEYKVQQHPALCSIQNTKYNNSTALYGIQNTKYNSTTLYSKSHSTVQKYKSTARDIMQHTEYKIQQHSPQHIASYIIQNTTAQPAALQSTTAQDYTAYIIQNTTQPTGLYSIYNTKYNTAHNTTKYNSTGLYSIYNTKYNTAHRTIQHI